MSKSEKKGIKVFFYLMSGLFDGIFYFFGIPIMNAFLVPTNTADRLTALIIQMAIMAVPWVTTFFSQTKKDEWKDSKKDFQNTITLKDKEPAAPSTESSQPTVQYPINVRIKRTEILIPVGAVAFKPVGQPTYELVKESEEEQEETFEIVPDEPTQTAVTQ